MTDYSYVLSKVYPGKEWTQVGDEYEGITWLDGKPISKEELDTQYEQYKQNTQYIRDREKEYPSIVDQLDLIYHKGVEGWKAEIKRVKDKYPKPT